MTTYMSAVVEGDVDDVVVRRLIAEAGMDVSTVHVKYGKQNVRTRIASYNAAARQVPFFVLVDLDREYGCAPELIADWLPTPAPQLYIRVAVRAVEAWLLGDRQRIASFLRVKPAAITDVPEALLDPKRALVDLARLSTSRAIREDVVPRSRSGRTVGPAYSSRLIEFVTSPIGWRPQVAAETCDSLRRARSALVAAHMALKMTR
jgi:hypothetical protein